MVWDTSDYKMRACPSKEREQWSLMKGPKWELWVLLCTICGIMYVCFGYTCGNLEDIYIFCPNLWGYPTCFYIFDSYHMSLLISSGRRSGIFFQKSFFIVQASVDICTLWHWVITHRLVCIGPLCSDHLYWTESLGVQRPVFTLHTH